MQDSAGRLLIARKSVAAVWASVLDFFDMVALYAGVPREHPGLKFLTRLGEGPTQGHFGMKHTLDSGQCQK